MKIQTANEIINNILEQVNLESYPHGSNPYANIVDFNVDGNRYQIKVPEMHVEIHLDQIDLLRDNTKHIIDITLKAVSKIKKSLDIKNHWVGKFRADLSHFINKDGMRLRIVFFGKNIYSEINNHEFSNKLDDIVNG